MENTDAQYVIFKIEPLEVTNKAQVLVYAHLTQYRMVGKEELEHILTEIYDQHKNTTGFNSFVRPTVVNVYLFTSEELGRKDKSAHIAWLRKGPNETEPIINVDESRLADLQAWDANEWTKDTVAFEVLNKALFERGLELCSFRDRLREIEADCVRKATLRYSSFELEHTAYNDELLAIAMSEVKAVHDLDDALLSSVHVFAGVHCR